MVHGECPLKWHYRAWGSVGGGYATNVYCLGLGSSLDIYSELIHFFSLGLEGYLKRY